MSISKLSFILAAFVTICQQQFLLINGLSLLLFSSASSSSSQIRSNSSSSSSSSSSKNSRQYSHVYGSHASQSFVQNAKDESYSHRRNLQGSTTATSTIISGDEVNHDDEDVVVNRVTTMKKKKKKKKTSSTPKLTNKKRIITKTPIHKMTLSKAPKASKDQRKKVKKKKKNTNVINTDNNSTQVVTIKKIKKMKKIKKKKKETNTPYYYYNITKSPKGYYYSGKGKKKYKTKSPKGLSKKKSKGKGYYYYTYYNNTDPVTNAPTEDEENDDDNGRGDTDDENTLDPGDNIIDEFRDEDDDNVETGSDGNDESVEEEEEEGQSANDDDQDTIPDEENDNEFDARDGSHSNEYTIETGQNLIVEFRDGLITPAELFEKMQPGTFDDLNERYHLLDHDDDDDDDDDASSSVNCDETLRTLRLDDLIYIVKTFFSEIRLVMNEIKSNDVESTKEDGELEGAYIDDVFGISAEEINNIEKRLVHQLRHDVQIRSICAACNDSFKDQISNNTDYSRYCGKSTYEHGSMMSGTVFFPVQAAAFDKTGKDHSILKGKYFETFLHFRDFSYTYADSTAQLLSWFLPQIFVQLIEASIGSISLSFHQTGYGASSNLTPSPLIEKSVVASTLPLFYKVKSIVTEETNYESSVGRHMSLLGYGEGGYSSIAAANAFRRQGIVPSVFAGAAPTKTIAKISPLKVFDQSSDAYYDGIYLYELLFPYLLGLPMSRNEEIIPNPRSDLLKDVKDFLEPVGVNFIQLLFTNTSYPSGYVNPDGWYNALLHVLEKNSTMYEDMTISDVLFQGKAINLELFELYNKFKANNNQDPCLDAGASFDQICKALKQNDLFPSIETADFPIRLCHSMEDELISYHNLPNQFVNPQFISMTETFGKHDQASLFCTLEFLNILSVKRSRS